MADAGGGNIRDYSVAVRIEGLAELRRDMRGLERTLPRVLTTAHRNMARKVADVARPNLLTKTDKPAVSRLTAGATQSGGYVQLRGPTAFGDEYGANRFKQFRPHRGREGYAVWPAVREMRPLVEAEILDYIEAALEGRALSSGGSVEDVAA